MRRAAFLIGAMAMALDSTALGAQVLRGGRTITDARGQYRVTLVGDGAQSLRIVWLGFRPVGVARPSFRATA